MQDHLMPCKPQDPPVTTRGHRGGHSLCDMKGHKTCRSAACSFQPLICQCQMGG